MIDINFALHKALSYDGFGRLIRQMIEAMLVSGDFDVHPYLMEMLEWPGWMQSAAGLDHSRPTLFLCPPDWIEKPAPSRTWLYAMHESDALPEGWADIVNENAERLIVPCSWCADVYRDSGTTIPISVVKPGIDFNECSVLPPVRKGTRPYTFLALGDRGIRKGYMLAYAAFFQAFRPDDNVSLIIKSNLTNDLKNSFRISQSFDAISNRVRIWSERVDDIRDIFAQADCVVYPAFGDGWGMFPREGAACGLPVIATNYSGLAVECDQWAYPLNDFTLVPAPGKDLPGRWAFPNVKELADRMRFCYDHQEDARQKGLQSAHWLRENCTWEQSVAALKEVFESPDREKQHQRQVYEQAETRKSQLPEIVSDVRGDLPPTVFGKEFANQHRSKSNGVPK